MHPQNASIPNIFEVISYSDCLSSLSGCLSKGCDNPNKSTQSLLFTKLRSFSKIPAMGSCITLSAQYSDAFLGL